MKYGNGRIPAAWMCALVFGIFPAYAIAAGEILKATPEQFDFGAIPEGEPAVVVASVENIGDAPVEITGAGSG